MQVAQVRSLAGKLDSTYCNLVLMRQLKIACAATKTQRSQINISFLSTSTHFNVDKTFSSVQLLTHVHFCDPMDCSTPGLPVHHQLPEFTQTHVHQVVDAIQPSHPLSSHSPSAFNLFQHQGLFQWVSSSHQVAKVLELQLQHQSFQWIFRTDFL